MKTKELELIELSRTLVDEFYKKQNAGVLNSLSKRNYDELSVSREKILSQIRDEMSQYEDVDGNEMTEEQKDEVLELVRKELWGYGIIDGLIHDKEISDIKIYNDKQIRVKRYGKRMDSGVRFANRADYKNFVTRLLERNKVNLGTANAIQTFTDATQDDFILRITAISGLLTDSGNTCIAIRKIPKEKYTLRALEQAGMFNHLQPDEGRTCIDGIVELKFLSEVNEQFDVLFQKMIASKGILFTGKGASGKTTLMNAMLKEIPWDESVMICQENAELFDEDHPDLLAAHVMISGGDSKVSYNLGDLTRAALLVDLDRVIVGEVKEGSEAAGLSKASMTGHKCWTSVHGESCEMAVDKMADYISQATGYKTKESLKQLCGFEYVIHLRNFRIDEIKKIDGWDKNTDSIILKPVYPFEEVVDEK